MAATMSDCLPLAVVMLILCHASSVGAAGPVSQRVVCSRGQFIKDGIDCAPCPLGHKCPDPQAPPVPCPPGTHSKHELYGFHGHSNVLTDCEICSRGNYQEKSGQTKCHPCPEGHKCPNPVHPIQCPPGTYGNHEAYRDFGHTYELAYCKTCGSGYYQDKPGQTDCMECPQGHKCPDPKVRPIPCPTGSKSRHDEAGSSVGALVYCRICPDGYYQDKQGQSSCIPCPQGRHCPPPKNRAIPCPAGTMSAQDLSSRVRCVSCGPKHYQDKTGQGTCLFCPEGHECPTPKNQSIPCSPGYINSYSMFRYDFLNCNPCPAGFFQNREGQSTCLSCPDYHSCPQKESEPVPCPSGFTSASTARQRISCVRCSTGRCTKPGPPSVVCQAGMYLDVRNGTCKQCEPGQYQIYAGQTGCKTCPEGFYCPTSTAKPIPCPPGTYSTMEMGVRTACLACSAGTYQTEQGENFCLECPAGHFCPSRSQSPVPCQPGTHATDSTTNRMKCLSCSEREYQDQSGQDRCQPCPTGYFCPRPDLSPQQCPPNTYSTKDETDRKLCIPCYKGRYQDQSGQAQCKRAFADGSYPQLKPNSMISSLNTSEVVASSLCDGERSTYAGAVVHYMEGNHNVTYPVVKISHEHLSTGMNGTSDNYIYVSTALAFDRMASAAKSQGVTITINSGFREYKRQVELYNCYKNKTCNEGNEAAFPGKSNHGTGRGLDLNTNCNLIEKTGKLRRPPCNTSAVYVWLKNNGHKFGFLRTVPSEAHHWEYQGGPVTGPSNFT